jgi:hypothetical protein
MSIICNLDSASNFRSSISPITSRVYGRSRKLERRGNSLRLLSRRRPIRNIGTTRSASSGCCEHPFDPLRSTLCSVGPFLGVRTRRIGGSAATPDSTMWAIGRHSEVDELPEFLSRADQLLLLDRVKEFQHNDKRGVHRVRPLSRLLLDLVYRKGKQA